MRQITPDNMICPKWQERGLGSTEQHAEAIARWILGIVLIGYGYVALQPILWRETEKFFEETSDDCGWIMGNPEVMTRERTVSKL